VKEADDKMSRNSSADWIDWDCVFDDGRKRLNAGVQPLALIW